MYEKKALKVYGSNCEEENVMGTHGYEAGVGRYKKTYYNVYMCL